MFYTSITDAIGRTPIIRLDRYCQQLQSRIFLKLEYLNPGGSHKARIALNMVRSALVLGHLKPGDTIIEATGGNTGKGIVMAATVFGCKVVLVVPDSYSERKVRILQALGADVRRSQSSKGVKANGEMAMELQFEHPEWCQLLQMENPANPQIHRQTTGPEILQDMSPLAIDYLVCGFGTGGHLTGIGELIKTSHKHATIVAVQPEECDVPSGVYRPHKLQGFAVGSTPKNLNLALIDEFANISYQSSIEAIDRLLLTEAIGVGPSSGAVLAVATRIASTCANANIVCLAYDSLEDYPEVIEQIIEARKSGMS